MTEYSQLEITEQEFEQKQERFRYTDLSHPVMQVLFNLQLESTQQSIADFD